MQTDLQTFIPYQELTADMEWKPINPQRQDWLKDKDWVSTVHSLDKLGGGIKSQGNLKITYTSEDEWYALGARYIVVLMSGAILVYR